MPPTFQNRYGRFTPDGTEYHITTQRTPRPWINVISNGDYGLTVSQNGSGYSWRTHAQLNRVTRWEQDLVRDEWGKFFYLRDERGRVWSAGWKPVCAKTDAYDVRHGPGYTVITSRIFGIQTELTVFVPNDDPVELWLLRVTNRSRTKRRLDLYSYCEWALGQSPDWHREFHKSFIETSFEPRARAILAVKRLWEVPTERGHWNTDWPYVAFHASSEKPVSWDTDKESFLGMYGDLRRPAAVSGKPLAKRSGKWLDAAASLHHRIVLQPGVERTIVFSLGCADSVEHARLLAARYRSPAAARRAYTQMQERWGGMLGTVRICTPDPAMNVMQNVWLKYQAISGRMWARTAYYQTGGAYGFRDQLQDSMLWLSIEPEQTLRQIHLHARHQFADGSVYHWWHPLSEVGLRNEISDNLLWLPYVMAAYLRETGDPAVLEELEPFVDSAQHATLYDHCCRAVDRALGRFSTRGLPLIGAGDWNDGLSAVGLGMKGESVWLGHFLHRILIDFAGVARTRSDEARAVRYEIQAEALRVAINAFAWDGQYYLGATKDSGEPLGSSANAEGSLWLNPQTWAIIGNVADSARAEQVMDVVERRLECEIGPLLLTPAYSTPDPEIGYLTRYSPGMRENGGVYTHGATWAVIAAAMLGRGDAAYRLYNKLNPVTRGRRPDRYKAEPYVTAGNIEGPDSAFFGRGGWTWYSGSAAWLYRVGLEHILGVRPAADGLLIDPCIPHRWKRFSVRRVFRGAEYLIEVRNPRGVQCGVTELLVDGEPVCTTRGPRGKTVEPFPAGSTHTVVATLG
jgi:cellobiose phosphorylase